MHKCKTYKEHMGIMGDLQTNQKQTDKKTEDKKYKRILESRLVD